ncbi:Chaperonin-like RbcX [Gracilaria domingensis]|nr:Chaperonin-like RbcX [Gracilaria domingensis]
MHELGDNITRNWLKSFDDFSGKVEEDRFVDADDYLQRMMRAESESKTVQISHLGGRLVRNYDIVIEPYRIAKRIFAIRKQLAGEWAKDLRCVRMENLEIQRMAVESILCSNEAELQSKRNLIFDSDPFSNDNSPLRYKNYHALKTLTTRHAVSRLLPYIRDCGPNHDYMYLLQFCKAYGSIDDGDDFVKKLMAKPLENRTHPNHLIQPRGLALQILELRWAIAEEWISIMKFIPEEHMLMNRSILERSVMMEVDSERGDSK